MVVRLMPIACILLAASATAHAQATQDTYRQCVYNQGGFVATVRWFASGTLRATNSGDRSGISATRAPFQTETISVAQKSCVGGMGTRHAAVITVRGAIYVRAYALAAGDIGGGTIGCATGVVGLSLVTSGAGALNAAGCASGGDPLGMGADSSVVPQTRELLAIVQPPATSPSNPVAVIVYGTGYQPQVRAGRP